MSFYFLNRVKNDVPDFVQESNETLDKPKETVSNPFACINLFWTEEWIQEL